MPQNAPLTRPREIHVIQDVVLPESGKMEDSCSRFREMTCDALSKRVMGTSVFSDESARRARREKRRREEKVGEKEFVGV